MTVPHDPDQHPPSASGYVRLGVLEVPGTLATRLEAAAAARGVPVMYLVVEYLAARVIGDASASLL